MEIYNERVKDLLSKTPGAGGDLEVREDPRSSHLSLHTALFTPLSSQVREDAQRGTHIAGAVEVSVASLHEIMEHMQRGSLYRTTEATNCNEFSSRSHAVLQALPC